MGEFVDIVVELVVEFVGEVISAFVSPFKSRKKCKGGEKDKIAQADVPEKIGTVNSCDKRGVWLNSAVRGECRGEMLVHG